MKASELEGRELDAWVARAEGWAHLGAVGEPYDPSRKDDGYRYCLSGQNDWWNDPEGHWVCGPCCGAPHEYSTDWARGGPIIEKAMITVKWENTVYGNWRVQTVSAKRDAILTMFGPTPLVAAMRVYVASKFGVGDLQELQRQAGEHQAAQGGQRREPLAEQRHHDEQRGAGGHDVE